MIRFMQTFNDRHLSGDFEPAVQATLLKHLKPGMTFYDVGANGGFMSLLGACAVGPSGKVIAFEPHPAVARQLAKQMRINDMPQVEVVVAAVSDRIGAAKFSDGSITVMNSLARAKHAEHTIDVRTTTLDHEAQMRQPPDLLKIDVEGSEIDVIRGAEKMIRARQPILVVEVHSAELAAQYDKLLAELGYETEDLRGHAISVAKSGERFSLYSRPRRLPSARRPELHHSAVIAGRLEGDNASLHHLLDGLQYCSRGRRRVP